jgi:hypothetical protein
MSTKVLKAILTKRAAAWDDINTVLTKGEDVLGWFKEKIWDDPKAPAQTLTPKTETPAAAAQTAAGPGLVDKAKAGLANAVTGVKDWAAKPGLTGDRFGLNRGKELAVGAGLAGAGLLLHKLLKKRRPVVYAE